MSILGGSLITNLKAYRVMKLWVDAYTARLEAVAEAQNDKNLHGRMTDNLRKINADRLTATSETAQQELAALHENQAAVLQRSKGFDLDSHHEIQGLWRNVSRELLATGWSLDADLECEVTEDKPPKLQMWQGNDKPKVFAGKQAALVMAFLNFVKEYGDHAADPRQLVIEQLTSQGITKDNFHLHKDKLLVSNPWTGEE